MGTILTKIEERVLLDKITSKEVYNKVLDFLADKDMQLPFTKEEMRRIAKKAERDAKEGKGTLIENVRELYPR